MKTNQALPLSKQAGAAAATITCLLLLSAVPAEGQSQYGYVTNADNISVTITNYTGPGGVVTIPTNLNGLKVTGIGSSAFASLTNLTSITIPSTVTGIADYAFNDCYNLTSATISNGVASIGNGAFQYCDLANVIIPGTVTNIGYAPFDDCISLAAITVNTTNSFYSSTNGVLFNKNQSTLVEYPGGMGGSYAIPSSVTSIGAYAFFGCTSLTSVTIPSGVTNIGGYAFDYCPSLTAITVNTNNSFYISVGGVLFNQNQATLIQYPPGEAGTSYTIPDSVTSIGESAFYECESLSSVIIPNTVTSIASGAFQMCSSLTNITIPGIVTSIGDQSFSFCSSLSSVTFGNSLTSIGDYAFGYCGPSLTSVYFAGNSPSADSNVFANDTNVTVYYYSGASGWSNTFAGVPAVPEAQSQFGYVTNANGTSVTITNYTGPGGAVIIPTNISGLTVTGIGDDAFEYNESITNVTIPACVTNIGSMVFADCSSLIAITVDTNSLFYSSTNGVLFDKSQTTLVECPGAMGGIYAIPNSVTSIAENAFIFCTNLASVTISGNVTNIGVGAFSYCFSLTNATIGNGATSIGGEAFYDCPSLKNVTMGNGVTSIGDDAFVLCTNLTSVTIPNSVIDIGGAAFYDCSGLTNVTIGNGVTSIGVMAFYGCTDLTNATIGNGVTSIWMAAFSTCTNLTSVYFKGNAPTADSTAFTNDTYVTVYYYAGASGWSNTFAGVPAVALPNAVQNFNTLPLTPGDNWVTNGNGNTSTYGQTFTVPFPGNVLVDWTFYLKNIGLTPQNFEFFLMAWNGSMATGPILYQSGLQTVTAIETNYTAFTVHPNVALTSSNQYVMFISTSDPADGLGLNGSVDGALALAGQGPFFGHGGPATSPLGGAFWFLDNGNTFSEVTSSNWTDFEGTTGFTAYNADFSSQAQPPGTQPTITTQPASPPPTLAGLFATFTVGASGGPLLNYQWFHNSVPLSPGSEFSGVNSPTLTVDPVSLSDAGAYTVTVFNFYGSTNSSNAVLSVLPDTTALEDFEAGTNCVARGDFALASLSFANALTFSPTNGTYNFFQAASELLSLPEEPAGSNFLSHIGFGSAGRDIFNWQAEAPTNANGHLEIPVTTPPLDADEFTAQLRTNVLPAIVAAQNNLAQITDTHFTVDLTTNETHAGAVTVDWGDVQMLRAMYDSAELFIYTTYSWNLDVQLITASNYFGKDGSFEAFLTNYPSFLTTTSTADLPAARSAFTHAINAYFAASQFIRNRPPGEIRLFNLSTDDLAKELQFRQTLSNLLASLNRPVVVFAHSPNTFVSMQAFFGGNFDLGSYLPEFQGDNFVWNTFPDTTFGGFITGLTETQIDKAFLKRPFHSEGVLDVAGTSLSVLYNFTNYSTQTGVVQGTDGNFYGTMATGGPYIGVDTISFVGYGSVFKITPSGQFSTLYSFGSNQATIVTLPAKGYRTNFNYPLDGAYPNALVLGSDGNLYGTTQNGGLAYFISNAVINTNYYHGTVFKITTNGQLTTLYNLGGNADLEASTPAAALVEGTNGLFYGTTSQGGGGGAGTVFAISINGAFTLLGSFPSQSVERYAGNYETVYPGGQAPATPLVQGSDGNFYGTTTSGGILATNIFPNQKIHTVETNVVPGYGTIFMVTPLGQGSLLYTFGTQQDGNGDPLDGALPNGLVQGADGNLYGTTVYGGANDDYIGLYGGFYGGSGSGDGTLFSISPTNANSFTTLLSFDENFPDGYNPIGSLVPGPDGTFYGVASAGGANKRGAVFIFNATNRSATNLVWLTKSSGGYGGNAQNAINSFSYYYGFPAPAPSFLTYGLDGKLYGTTTDDGTNGDGTVYRLDLSGVFGVNVTLTTPFNGQSFPAPAIISLSATVASAPTNTAVSFYNGTNLLGTATTPPYGISSNFAAGTYAFTAVATNNYGLSATSAVAYVTVNTPGTTLIDFDPLADLGPVEGGTALSGYLAQYRISVTNNSPGTTVVAENQAYAAGGGFVIASSQPNLLTQNGSNGPVSFTVGFATPIPQFSFTRPELLANPSVSHPAWQASAFDPLGDELDSVQEPLISSSTNVPAQTYTLNGGSIASVEFSSEGTGFTTFNAMLLDDFLLTNGNSSDLPPSVLITNPINGQVFTSAEIPISVETAPGAGTVTNVTFYYGDTLAGSAQTIPFSITTGPLPNGAYVLTAVAVNNFGLSSTSAPVAITVASGFAIATPPMSQTIALGNNATFSVTTTLTNGVTYQWQLNGTNIAGATLSSYTVSNAPLSAAGNYTVVAVFEEQRITNQPPAVLTVLAPPTLGTNSITTNGGNITLSVSASDSVSFYSQWQLNGNHIPGATNNYAPGTTVISYTISNAPFDSGNYQVVVANVAASAESSNFDVAVGFGTNAPVTTNDNFGSSLTINPLLSGVAGNNSGSPATGELPKIAGKPAGNFLWYNWTASFTGIISLTTRGSSFDTLLGVYTGSAPASLTSVAEDDDSGGFFTSLATFNCQSNTTYQIAVAGYQGAAGNVVLELSPGPPLLPGPTNGYTTSGVGPVITQQPVSQIVHAGDTVTLSVTFSGNANCQWYFADVPVAGGINPTLVISNFPAVAVGNYYIQLPNAFGTVQSATAAIQIAAENQQGTKGTPTTLLVDKFGDAVDLTGIGAPDRYRPADGGGDTGGFTLSQSFSTTGATRETGEPTIAGQPGGASYWYSYTAPASGTLEFNTAGSAFNTMLAVYTGPGTSFSTLVNVGAAFTTNYLEQGQPVILISNVVAKTQYFIAIDGYLGASGSAYLNIILNPPTNGPINTNAVPMTNNTPVIAITSPANNYLTTSSNINVRGTVKGSGGQAPAVTSVQVAINTNAFGQAAWQQAQKTIDWFTNVTLVPGANLITAQSITVEDTNTEFASAPVTHTVFYASSRPSPLDKSFLTLVASPSSEGKITGQPDNANLEINKVYTVKAVPIGNCMFSNWTSTNSFIPLPNSASLSFLMSSNLSLQANFVPNPFTAFTGVYNGLFSPTNGVTEASSGFFTATLPAASRGAYSAKLLLDGGSYPFSGTFDLSGDAGKTVTRSGKPPLSVVLHLDLAATNNQMTGSVSDNATNAWDSELRADRAVFNAKSNEATDYAGKYTLIIPPGINAPTNEPLGYGYATLAGTLAGLVSLSGHLADNTAFSQSVPVATNGNIPLYASLYSHKGSLQGWVTLTSTSNNPAQTIQGTNLAWIRPSTLHLGGFTNTNITVLGSRYTPPAAGANNFTLTNGTLTISGNPPYSNLTIVGDKLVNNGPGDLKGVITPGNGILTVTFRPAGATSDTVAKGVVLQDQETTNAAGWFLDTDQSGSFLLLQQ
jgi:uncharacterized repeat protein (TIGR03803 family)